MQLWLACVEAWCEKQPEISDAAYKLVSFGCAQLWQESCPVIGKTAQGKPFFAEWPDRYLSVSHSGKYILVGLDVYPLGVDLEREREMRLRLQARIYSEQMRAQFAPLEAWTLREAIFKLTGQGNLMDMELERRAGRIRTPFAGVNCQSYIFNINNNINNINIYMAVASYLHRFPAGATQVEPGEFFSCNYRRAGV